MFNTLAATMMSRRKQLNPKPLNKGDCSDSIEDMTVDSRGILQLIIITVFFLCIHFYKLIF
ncbi:hypothetical protein FF38_10630 [Lucilia cuprina]|uniref:Uncharacterized protein n=1 Tax=Lucilia cuprina TaxID=7375 RepID=A0A0L0CAA0_LUCCU|nr:hypothetical protein FF38_10630 [Lucilia cuprina]